MIKKSLIIFFVFIIHFPAISEQTDSLENELKRKSHSQKDLIDIYLQLHLIYQNDDIKKSFEYIDKANEIAIKTRNPLLLGLVQYNYGLAYLIKSESPKALSHFISALKYLRNSEQKKLTIYCYLNIGEIMRSQSDHADGLKYLFEGLKYAVKFGYKEEVKHIYDRISAIYFETRDYSMTLSYIDSAINYASELNDDIFLASIYEIKGAVFRETSKYDSSLYYLNKAKEFAIRINSISQLAGINNNISGLYYKKNNYLLSIEYALKSLNYSLPDSIYAYMEVSYLMLSWSYEKLKNTDSAFHYFKLYNDVRWKIFTQNKTSEIASLSAKYDLENAEQKNERLILTNSLQKSKIQRQRVLIILIVLLLIFALSIPYLLNKKRHHLKKVNLLLHQ